MRRLLLFFLDVKDFFAAVVAAFGANAVGTDHRAAVRASDEAGDFELEVGTAESFTGFRDTSLRYCHFCFLLVATGQIKPSWEERVNAKI